MSASVLDILVLIHLTGAWILELLNHFSRLIALSVDLGLFGYSLLTSVFDYGLLPDRLTHATTSEAAETARLKAGETSTAANAPSEEVIVVHHHRERISGPLSLRLTLLHAATATLTHRVHAIKQASAAERRRTEATTEKVVVIVKKSGKWVSATEEFSENVIGITHIEMSRLEA